MTDVMFSAENALRDEDRTAVFIDGANLFSTIRALEFQMDWRRLYYYLHSRTRITTLNYYSAINQEDDGTIHLKKLLDFIEYNGYTMRTKMAKRIRLDDENVRVKGNMDIEITLDVIQAVPSVDHIILFTGDGDFSALLRYVQRQGKKASVVSSNVAKSASVSDDLRRGATHFIELAYLKEDVELMRKETPAEVSE